MRRQVLSGVLSASLLVVAAVSSAYAGQSATLTAKIPFAFSVGAVSLPAGDYKFLEDVRGAITIRGPRLNEGMYSTVPGMSTANDGKARLIFHRYGDQYFLSEVFNGLENASCKFPVSKLEKDHIGAASVAVAENSQPRDVVVFGTR